MFVTAIGSYVPGIGAFFWRLLLTKALGRGILTFTLV